MSEHQQRYRSVTAVLPSHKSGKVVDAVIEHSGASALQWRARGTILQKRRVRRWVPPISPAKTMLQMIVPEDDTDALLNTIVTTGRLHQQATGAVFSAPCDRVFFGSQYHKWPCGAQAGQSDTSVGLRRDFNVIYCIVSHRRGLRVSKAAINAGAHGPVVHYCEGRGLRDQLGWLRIAKEPEQEVLIVVVDRERVDDVFEAMAAAGEFHLPGRGLMYHTPVDRGMVNLSSRESDQFHAANMQQVIRAIDHLNGHSHWRDSGASGTGSAMASTGRGPDTNQHPALLNQQRLTAIVRTEDTQSFSDLVLGAGVPGLTVCSTFFTAADEGCQIAGARINSEYSLFRSVLEPALALRVEEVLRDQGAAQGLNDLCVYSNPIPRVARYVPGATEYRKTTLTAEVGHNAAATSDAG